MNSRVRRSLTAAFSVTLAFASAAVAQRVEHDGLVYDNVPPADPALVERLASLQQSRGMRLLDWLADGSLAVAMRVEDGEQLHRLRTPLATPELLSPADDQVLSATAQPFQPDALAVLRQARGKDATLVRIDVASGESRLLLGPDWRPEHPLFAHDGKHVACSAALRGLEHDVFTLDSTTSTPPQLRAGDAGDWQAVDWSQDDRSLLLLHRSPLGAMDLQLLDLDTGYRRAVTSPASGERLRAAQIAPDGRGALYLSEREGEYSRLHYVSFDGSVARDLTPVMRRDVDLYAISGNGRYLAYSYSEAGWSRLVMLDQQAAAERIVTSLPVGVISALKFDRSGAKLAINVETSVTPADIFVLDIASNALVRWTQASAGPLGVAGLSIAQPIRFRTWDQENGVGRQLPGFVYRPQSHTARLPVLIYLDGSGNPLRPGFDPLLQSLVDVAGFAVITPTVRGSRSSGSGPLTEQARDIGALLVWIAGQPDLDSGRIAILGTGARSALALSATALFSDRLQRAVVVDGNGEGAALLAIQRPVLVTRGFTSPTLSASGADQLMWRLRAARSSVSLFGRAGDAPGYASAAQRAELARVIVQFLTDGGGPAAK